MAFGILGECRIVSPSGNIDQYGSAISEDRKLDNVPGTGLLSAKADQLSTDEAKELKHGTGKFSHVILIPQPSEDPRDP